MEKNIFFTWMFVCVFSSFLFAQKLPYLNPDLPLDTRVMDIVSILTLYPFGFGLSYTTFTYSDLHVSKNTINKNETINAEVTVKNAGKFKSDEVVQLYITHENIGIAVPLYSLKAFKIISLKPGASTIVKFAISPEMLSLINDDGKNVQLPGTIKISITDSLPSKRSEKLGAAEHVETVITMQ